VEESNHLGPTRALERPNKLLYDHVMMQQVPFHISTLEMLRISIDYVALFLYVENISVVVDVLHSSQSHTICVAARRSGHNGQPLLHGL
jgi:hypothetical protein